MKRILSMFLALLTVVALAGCAKTRAQDPVIEGHNPTPEVKVNTQYNPLEGVKAYEKAGGKDISGELKLRGWDDENLTAPGYYDFSIYVTNKWDREVSVSIKLTVLTADGLKPDAPILVGVRETETFFIGSGSWDPKTGVSAKTSAGDDLTENIKITGAFLLDTVGSYTITYTVEHEGIRARATTTLHVVSSEVPNELSKTAPIKITLAHAMGASNIKLMESYRDSFLAKMKAQGYTNITIEIPTSSGNYDTLKNNMINQITAGKMPNMVQGYPDHVAEYLNGKAVLNLNPYIEHEVWGLHGEDALEDIIEVYRRENSQYDTAGTYYSLPFNKSTEIMTYNKTALDAVADKRLLATNPSATEEEKAAARLAIVPKTWQDIVALKDDLMAYALEKITADVNADATIKEADKQTEINKRYALTVPAAIDSAGNGFITFTRQWGGQYTSLNPDFSGKLHFHEDANTFAAMEWLKANNTAITLPNFWDQQYASTPFLAGQTFITIGSSAGIRYNDPEGNFELGAAPIPYNADKPEHRSVMQQGTNISLMKTGTADEMLASWLFLKHMINTENTAHWSMNTGYLPVRTSAYTSPEYQAFLNNPTANEKLISLSANASYLQTEFMKYDPAFIGSSRARQQVGDALIRIVTGDGNIRQALDEAYAEASLGSK